jgi:hypothetical protein
MKREYPITVEEYLVERGVRGFEKAVERFSTEYQAFQRGELEDVVVGAVGDCWSFQDREIQVRLVGTNVVCMCLDNEQQFSVCS